MKRGPSDNSKIADVAGLLKQCRSILFITGAGISADSGLPTYRGIGGLYNGRTTDEGIPIETALAGEMLATNPSVTWKYLARIEEGCRRATFNRAHEVIAGMERHFERVWVLTQNIDGFHSAAGSRNVIDIHGDMHELFCPGCAWRATVKDYSRLEIPPKCPLCGRIVRPAVVFFGEMLPYDKTQVLFEEMDKSFDIYFSVGTTSVFPYIQEPMLKARSLQRPTVEINPDDTEISSLVDVKISMGAAEALDRIWEQYRDS
ncbi:MAG: NAD-dependent protein deacylase [Candidatus Makaraimicrobium thalassicum]|nr:MAG: NAD-dependent protein deacylase [Candidatus Omnitrophota bacterium]